MFERLTGRTAAAASRLHVRSALNPVLWLCAVVTVPLFILAWLAHGIEPLSSVLTWVATAPVAVACLMAVYFALFKPDKLQSEDYQLRHETLALIREKGGSHEIAASSLDVVSNPVHHRPDDKVNE